MKQILEVIAFFALVFGYLYLMARSPGGALVVAVIGIAYANGVGYSRGYKQGRSDEADKADRARRGIISPLD